MLNEQQQIAVNSTSKKILCLAGAGTGKTHTMINRLSHLVDDLSVSTARILVLTFTNAAALEMKERYVKAHPGLLTPKFGTFHSFCYSLIVENADIRNALGYTKIPSLMSDEDEKLIDTRIRQTLHLTVSRNKLKGKGVLTTQEKFEKELYEKAFKKELAKSNLITFDIMCNDVCKLFEDEDECAEPVKQRYKYLFVDEFQDTDPIQWRFIQSFPEDTNIFIVGDVQQAIYAFRGADSSIIKSIARDDSWEVVKLIQNYRSTKEICDFANKIGDKDVAYSLDLVSIRDGEPVVIDHGELERYNQKFKLQLFGYLDLVYSRNEDLAILVRTNAEVQTLCEILKSNKVSFTTNAKPTDAVNILKSCLSDDFQMNWLASLLPGDKYSQFIKMYSLNEDYDIQMFLNDFGNYWAVSKNFSLIADVDAVARDGKMFPYQRISKIIQMLKLPEVVIDFNQSGYDELIEYCIQIAEGKYMSFISKDCKSTVYVGTIHSSKGLEYDSVLLAGVAGPTFRLTNEENLNLYYVGCTRAKNHLKIIRGD